MSIFSSEKFLTYPLPEDGVAFGKLSASGISALAQVGNIIFSGSYSFDTVTITLKGITTPPFTKPTAVNFANQTFTFRGRNWVVLEVTEGAKFKVAEVEKFASWSVTGVDLNTPLITIQ